MLPMTYKYILTDDHEAVPCNDALQWARWYENADRVVASTYIGDQKQIHISTVFLGIAHNYDTSNSRTILFETMIFCNGHSAFHGYQVRYSTWYEAVLGHEEACKHVTIQAAVAERLRASAGGGMP